MSLVAGSPYSLTFDLASSLNLGSSAQVSLDAVEILSGISVFGAPQTFTRPSGVSFAEQQMSFTTLGAGDYRLSASSPDGFLSNVDNFHLASVPEPSESAILGAVGLLAYSVLRRRF